jgi:hypothetical protein
MLVVALEELVAHGSIGCDQKIPWPRYPVHHLVIFRDICVEYPEFPNHFAADIGEERVRNLVSLTESFQDLAGVVSYRRGIDSVCLEILERELQLDELIAAIGSPIGAAAEDQQ